jgi:putative transposase
MFALDCYSAWLGELVPQRDRLGKLELRYDPRDISHIYARDPETREFRSVERRDGMLVPMTLWEHEADRLQQRSANARTDVEKVKLRRRIAEIAGRTKPTKAELRNAVRKSHAADAPKPYDAMRSAAPAPADHPVRPKRRLPVEDW